MTITLTVAGRIATVDATTHVVAGNTYPVTLSLDSEWTGSLYLRVRFGSLYYDIPFASSAASVDVQMPVGYPEVGIGIFSEALEICTNETRVRLLRSILEQGVSVVEFDSDLYDQWAGEVSELLCDDSFDSTSDRPVKNSVITAWKDTVPLDSALVHKTGNEEINGEKTFIAIPKVKRATGQITLESTQPSTDNVWKGRILAYDQHNGASSSLADILFGNLSAGNYVSIRAMNPSRDGTSQALAVYNHGDHMSVQVTAPYYPVDGGGNPQPLPATHLESSGNVAVDPRIVHTTGTEAIAGDKTLSGTFSLARPDPTVNFKSSTTTEQTGVKANIVFYTSNAVRGQVFQQRDASTEFIALRQQKLVGSGFSELKLRVDSNDVGWAECPSYTADNYADAKIVTRAMLATTPTVVHTTGNETIAGTKKFSAPIDGMLAQTSVATATTHENMWVKCFSIPAENGVNLHFSVRTSYNSPDFSYAKFSIGAGGNTASMVSAHCTLSTGYTQETASMSNYKVTLETVDGTAYVVFYMKKLIRYSSVFIEEKRFLIWSSPTQVTFYSNQASADEPVASDTVSIIPIVGYYLGGVQA